MYLVNDVTEIGPANMEVSPLLRDPEYKQLNGQIGFRHEERKLKRGLDVFQWLHGVIIVCHFAAHMSFQYIKIDFTVSEDIKETTSLALIGLWCLTSAVNIYTLMWLLGVSSSLHWLKFCESWCSNAVQILIRVVALAGGITAIVCYYVYNNQENLNALWDSLRSFTPVYVLAATITDLWLRNDNDISPGFNKVDELIVFSVY